MGEVVGRDYGPVDDDDDTGKELWATYSVMDHLHPRALASDVLLFDRLVFPVPESASISGNPTEIGSVDWRPDPEAVEYWMKHPEWEFEKQARVLDILEPVLRKVHWGQANSESDTYQTESARLAEQGLPDYAFRATRTELTRDLAEHVKGVAVLGPAFRNFADADRAYGFSNERGRRVLPGEFLPTLLVWNLVMPDLNDTRLEDHEALKVAVDFAQSSSAHRAQRDAFVKWQRKFVRRGLTSEESCKEAVKEMRGLVADYRKELKREKFSTVVLKVCQFAPVAVPVAVAMTGGGGGLIASVGFGAWMTSEAVTRWRAKPEEEKKTSPMPAAFVFDTQRRLRQRRPWRGRWT